MRSWPSFAANLNATADLLGAFEPASFLGVGVGFLFEEQLGAGAAAVSEGDVVLVAGSTHAADGTVDWLRRRAISSPGTVAVVTNPNATSAGAQLLYTPPGNLRPPSAVAFLLTLPRVELHSARGALAGMAAVPGIAALASAVPARCAEAGHPAGAPAFGILCKFAVYEGRTRGLAINLGVAAAEVAIVGPATAALAHGGAFRAAAVTAVDVLTGVQQSLQPGRTLNLQSSQVLLLDLGPALAPKI